MVNQGKRNEKQGAKQGFRNPEPGRGTPTECKKNVAVNKEEP
jgi:hypothetical protein